MVEQEVRRGVSSRVGIAIVLFGVLIAGPAWSQVDADDRPAVDGSPGDAVGAWLNSTVGSAQIEDRPILRHETHRSAPGNAGTAPRSETGATTARMAWPLGVVLAVVFLAAYFAKRWLRSGPGTSSGGAIQVLARHALSPKQSLCLVRFGQRMVLVGITPDSLSRVSEITDPQECALLLTAIEKGRASSFTNAFARLTRGGDEATERVLAEPPPISEAPVPDTSPSFEYEASMSILPTDSPVAPPAEGSWAEPSAPEDPFASRQLARTGAMVRDVVDRLRALSRGVPTVNSKESDDQAAA